MSYAAEASACMHPASPHRAVKRTSASCGAASLLIASTQAPELPQRSFGTKFRNSCSLLESCRVAVDILESEPSNAQKPRGAFRLAIDVVKRLVVARYVRRHPQFAMKSKLAAFFRMCAELAKASNLPDAHRPYVMLLGVRGSANWNSILV